LSWWQHIYDRFCYEFLPCSVSSDVTGCCAGVPARVELPVATLIHDTINTMSRDLQGQLRKQTYDFERADKVLADLGVRISCKNQPKKGKSNSRPPMGQKRPAGETADPPEESHPNKIARTDALGSGATPSEAAAQAADAAADAQAESILHVPTISATPLGSVSSHPQSTGGPIPAESVSESLPPAPLSSPKADAGASQTSLAAAAAAAMGGPSVTSANPDPSTAAASTSSSQEPAAVASHSVETTAQNGVSQSAQAAQTTTRHCETHVHNFSSDRGTSRLNGTAASSPQRAGREPAQLYDVNRYNP